MLSLDSCHEDEMRKHTEIFYNSAWHKLRAQIRRRVVVVMMMMLELFLGGTTLMGRIKLVCESLKWRQ